MEGLVGARHGITLTPFVEAELPQTLQWMNNPKIAAPFLRSGVITPARHSQWYERIQADDTQRVFAIHLPDGGHLGNVGFKNLDVRHRVGEMWIYLGEEAQGFGFGREAVDNAIRIGFEQLMLKKLYLRVARDNHAALSLYEKAGFRHEGTLHKDFLFEGRRIDVVKMAMLETEWRRAKSLGPKVALMQPMFLPWLGYFELMDVVDVFVFLDDFQFQRQSWGHRNRLFLSPGVVGTVTVPIQHQQNLQATFLEIEESANAAWRKKFLKSMQFTYAKAPFAQDIIPMVEQWLSTTYDNVAELEIRLIEKIAEYLNIRTVLRRSSSLHITDRRRSWRIKELLEGLGVGAYYSPRGAFGYMQEDEVFPLPGLPVYFQGFSPKPYPQVGSKTFVSHLSTLDALLNLPSSEVRSLLAGTPVWADWEQMRKGSV